jgi:CheY-like chemotaxis protein
MLDSSPVRIYMQHMKLRALIFDHQSEMCEMLRSIFAQRGYEVFTYPEPGLCPLKARSQCRCPADTVCADVILSDVQMPGGTGIDFVQALLEKGCHRPHIALMCGSWSQSDIERAARLGCKLFKKPFRLAEVSEWLDQMERSISPQRHLFDWMTGKR